jgi:tetratricopeptide (TPR) repeat protein
MANVRDTLSCAGLAVVGAALVATAANPLTVAVVAGGVATGVAGNLAADVWRRIDRAGASKLLRGWRGIDENHVVVQALRKSHIEALRAVLRTFRATARTAPNRSELEGFADQVEAFAKSEWKEAEKLTFYRPASLTSAEYEIRRAILNSLPANFSAALAVRRTQSEERKSAGKFEALRDAFVQGALAEIEIRTLPQGTHVPPLFAAIFLGTNVENSWFDYFMREAADRLKKENAFAAIWNAEQVSFANGLLRELTARLGRIESIVGAPLRTGAASIAKFKAAIRNRPADLLIARYRVTPYIDRGGLLEGSLAWVRSLDGPLAQGRLYIAPGGFGKTRFAIEMILALMAEGWNATFLSRRNAPDPTPGMLSDLMTRGEPEGSLIVVDYAESQIALLKLVADAAVALSAQIPIRVIGLARSARLSEGWWQGLQTEEGIASVFVDPAPIELIERHLEAGERTAFFDAASVAFRDALEETGLATPTVPPSDIRGQTYDRPLTVAMSAFLFARGVAPDQRVSVFERVFMEERRQWRRVLRVEADDDPAVLSLHRAAAQVTLVQGATRDGVAALIAADPRARAYGLPAQEQTRTMMARLYGDPNRESTFVRPIEPDLLGEHAAMAALAVDREGLIEATFATALSGPPLFPQDVAEILNVLTRATRYEHDTRTREAAAAALERLCGAVSALDGAQVRQVEASLPRFAVPLTRFRVAVARRVVKTSEDAGEEARALNNLAIGLSETGDRQAALSPARRAAEIYQQLAQDNPAAYLPALAMSLNNLANRLSETGDRQAALSPARRAAEIREQLAQDNPAAYLPALAMSLGTLGDVLSATRDLAGAISAYTDALRNFRACRESAPQFFAPYIAMIAGRLTGVLADAGRAEETERTLRAILGDELFEPLRSARSAD